MDVGALTWRNCWACGSHTHEQKDCWYTNVTCKKCGKRGRMTSVCWVNAGKAQKGKGKSESKGEKGDIQAVLLKWTRIEKLIQSELMNQHSKLTKLIQNEQLKPNSELITHGSMKQNWTDGTFPHSVTSIPTGQNSGMKCVATTWLSDTGADAQLMPQHVCSQLGEPELQEKTMMLRGANGQDLGTLGTLMVRSFLGLVNVQFSDCGCERRKTMSSEWNAAQIDGLRFLLQENGSYVIQQSSGVDVT